MSVDLILILIVIVLGFVSLYFLLRKLMLEENQDQQEVEDLINQVFGKSAHKIAVQSKEILSSEKEAIKTDLENKQRLIEKMVKNLQDDLNKKQDELRLLEKDRIKKFSQITTAIDEHQKVTEKLKVSAEHLAKVLSNNQARGEWGERIIEDLLEANGLLEGVHYLRQSNLGSSQLKPDITLLLPNQRRVAVDVKFPYAEVQKMVLADTKAAKARHLKQFARDLRVKVKKVAKYIDPEHDTLDYAILFVPNEMVFSFINQRLPEVIDEALAKRVIMVSPFTFLIVARTVIESYRNFMIGDKLKEVVKTIDEFVVEWGRFGEEFAKFGRSIKSLSTGYERLTATRTRQMNRKIKKIEDYRQGGLKMLED
ncbi:MAG: DNA recombination protein RmuC [Candidatus Pacebacteria bacterium]|nr:DNA recombination protein RmuC [Candidatus Paceibacterota bacterium]